MRYILILQWELEAGCELDDLIAFEDRLDQSLLSGSEVDGHDFGSGEMNVFVETDNPADAFLAAESAGKEWPCWPYVRAGYREVGSESYTVLWPPDLEHFRVK